MVKGLKKAIVLIISVVVLMCCASCEAKSKVDKDAETAPITSEWSYDHAMNKGENVPRYMFDSDKNLPHFSSDGETFTMNIVPGKEYSGTVVANDDGSYSIYNNGTGQPILVTIEGNSLTVHINDDTSVTYVVK